MSDSVSKVGKTGNQVQDDFLAQVISRSTSVTVYLVNGVKLRGRITNFDNTTVLLTTDMGESGKGIVDTNQLLYKSSIATILSGVVDARTAGPFNDKSGNRGGQRKNI